MTSSISVHTVEFLPARARVEVPAGTALLDAAAAAGVHIAAPCGGEGACGECRVRVEAGSVEHGGGCLRPADLAEGWVLACSSRVAGDVTIRVPELVETEVRIVTEGVPAGLPEGWKPEPLAVRYPISVDPPSPETPSSDLERIERALKAAGGPARVSCGLAILEKVAGCLRAGGPQVTAIVQAGDDPSSPAEIIGPSPAEISDPSQAEIIGLEPGDTAGRALGLAIDVGTTTCALQLVSLRTGRVVSTACDYNRQIERGLDVIGRINYARLPARRVELRELVLETLNRLVAQAAGSIGADAREIDAACVAGNPTMTHLLLGLDPEYIRLAPYTPTVNRIPPLRAREVGLDMNPEARVVFAPGVGSYVGGDIAAGLLVTALAGEGGGVRLFLDIGTNGEIVLGDGEWFMACACSAGPAFEGTGIGCGMRASRGAIERVRIDPGTGRAEVSVIGGGKPRGVCGSGMIDLLAELWRSGLLDPSGKLDPERSPELVRPEAGGSRALAYRVVDAGESATGSSIDISETDLQNLLRTKAAVYAACSLMLKAAGLSAGDVVGVYVAGGFGRFLDLREAIAVGMLPDLPLDRFTYLGNSSLAGARAMLLSRVARRRVQELAGRITYLELNTDPSYMDEFMAALFLPHTDGARFPSARMLLYGRG